MAASSTMSDDRPTSSLSLSQPNRPVSPGLISTTMSIGPSPVATVPMLSYIHSSSSVRIASYAKSRSE